MPKITVEQTHALSHKEIRQRLDGLREKLSTRYGLDAKWTSDTEASFKRTGASGTIHCPPGKVVVNLDLSFALTPMKATIETKIRDVLAKTLA